MPNLITIDLDQPLPDLVMAKARSEIARINTRKGGGRPAKLSPCPKCGELCGVRERRYDHSCKPL